MVNNKLELLAMASDYEVTKQEDRTFRVDVKDCNLCAIISPNNIDIEYYLTGVYNSGSYMEEIDVNSLNGLKKFCELMIKE